MLSQELEHCLNGAFHQARVGRYQYLTVEHLLLTLLDTSKVSETLGACGADLPQLKRDLQEHIDQSTPRLEHDAAREVQPTLAFQRVLQRAVFHVQSSGKQEVSVGNVLVAIFSEKQSQAVLLLNRLHITRLKVVNYISHGFVAETGTDEEKKEADAALLTLGDHMNRFRIASRELFNSYFRTGNGRGPWDDPQERFSAVESVLFHQLVTVPTSLRLAPYREVQPLLVVVPNADSVPWLLNRELDSGYWDGSPATVTKEARLFFIEFFDWDLLGIRDNRYVHVKVAEWPAHPDAVGKHALIETQDVRYVGA